MRRRGFSLLVGTCVLAVAAGTASAQTPQQQTALVHKAKVELVTGIVFASAGAWIAPITSGDNTRNPGTSGVGLGLLGVGGTLILLGLHDRQQAQHPSTNVGVLIGRNVGIQIRRAW